MNTTPSWPERYVVEDGHYALYLGRARVLLTRAVAVLLDTRLAMLITHGDPASVRRELDEMREILRVSGSPRFDEDWLLLEGHPDLHALNDALRDAGDFQAIKEAFAGSAERDALEATKALLERTSRR